MVVPSGFTNPFPNKYMSILGSFHTAITENSKILRRNTGVFPRKDVGIDCICKHCHIVCQSETAIFLKFLLISIKSNLNYSLKVTILK